MQHLQRAVSESGTSVSQRARSVVAVPLRVVATPYGSRAGVVLRQLVAEAKSDDPLAPVTVVVPSNYVGVSVRRTLARQRVTPAGVGITGIDLVTTYRLAELIAAPTLATAHRRPVSNPVVAAAIRQVLARGDSMFAAVAEHPSTERQLLRVHRELRDLGDEALDTLAAQSARATDVVEVHRSTMALLTDHWYDEFDLFAQATTIVAERPTAVAHRGRIIIHLPKVLTAAATGLIREIARHHDVVVLVGVTGNDRADTSARRLCDQLGVSLPQQPVPQQHGTRIVSVSDADDEVRTVIRHVLEALLDGTPLERMAIVHASDEPYARLLAEQLDAAGVQHNGAAVDELGHSVIGRTLATLLSLADHDHSRADVMAFLSSAPIIQRRGLPAITPTSAWERLSREAGITRGRGEWAARLERLRADAAHDLSRIDEHDDRPDRVRRRTSAARTEQTATELAAFVDELIGATVPSAVPATWPAKCDWIRTLLDRYLGSDHSTWPAAQAEAADRIDAALDRLAGLAAIESDPTLATFRRAVDVELETTVGRSGSFGDGIFVGRPGQLAGLELDRIFVVGMAEGVFPARRRDDSLLPDLERAAVGDALASVAGRIDDDHRDLLSALAAASGQRVLYHPRGDLRRSAERVPSRWLLDTATALADTDVWSEDLARIAREHEWAEEVPSFVAGLQTTAFPATDQEYEARRLIDLRATVGRLDLRSDELSSSDPGFGRSVELVEARRQRAFTRFDGNLTHLGADLDVGRGVVSPTRLESWAFCPHQYFMRHVLGIDVIERPDEARRITALDRGSLFHDVLDEFVNSELTGDGVPKAGQPWSAASRERLHEIVERQCDSLEARGLVGKRLFWSRDRRRIVHEVLRVLSEDPARQHPGEVIAAELAFGLGDNAPVEHRLPDGRSVAFRGSADRVDREADGTLAVIDYKTGSTYSFTDISRRDGDRLVRGTKLQLPVYALAAQRAHGSSTTPVHAYYWFITEKGNYRPIGYVVDDEVIGRFDEVLTTILDGLEAGHFPARPSGKSYEFFVSCEYCDPDHLGTGGRRREWERTREDPALFAYRELAEPESLLDPPPGAEANA